MNHLGNILSTISDRKLMHEDLPNNPGVVHHYTAEILSVQEQYAYGMNMPGRSFSVESYRFAMNGQEKSDEIFLGALTAEFWEYDSRIGRRWNMDPVVKPWESGYATFLNNPFYFMDPNGLDPVPRFSKWERFKNWIKGDGYLNDVNEYAVENNIDDSEIFYGANGTGKAYIQKTYLRITYELTPECEYVAHGTYEYNDKITTFTSGGSLSDKLTGWVDKLQTGLDLAGIADPTGIADGVNSLIYLGRGQWKNTGISSLGIIPFIGDAAKARRYSDDLIKAAEKLYPKKVGKFEKHHPFPKYMGGNKTQSLIKLPAPYHQQITNEFYKYWPKKLPGQKKTYPTLQQAEEIMEKVYNKYPLPKN